MYRAPDDFLKKVENLLSLGIGDATRLEHIRQSIQEDKKLYNSDIQYVIELVKKNSGLTDEKEEVTFVKSNNSCWNCKKELESLAKFCSYCGANQDESISDFSEVLSRRKKIEYNPLKIISNLHSYQILSVIGGICVLIPVLVALASIERIFEVLEFYSNRDFSEFFIVITSLGIISAIWSFLVIIIPFLIKKPKKVGKFLFFSAFGILVCSLMTGVVGFVIILFAGIFALKKRRY